VFVLFYFTVLSCACIFLCALCCLTFIGMFHIHMQLMQRLDQWNELYVCMYIHSPIPIPQKHGTQIVPKILHWRLVCFGVYDADSCANPQTIMWAYTGRTVISVQCNIGIMNWGLLHVVGKKPVFTFHKSYDDFDSLQMLLPWMGNVGIYFITNLNLRQLTLG